MAAVVMAMEGIQTIEEEGIKLCYKHECVQRCTPVWYTFMYESYVHPCYRGAPADVLPGSTQIKPCKILV